jgi:hypothetical protein
MNVIGHNDKSVNLQTFSFMQKMQGIENDLLKTKVPDQRLPLVDSGRIKVTPVQKHYSKIIFVCKDTNKGASFKSCSGHRLCLYSRKSH